MAKNDIYISYRLVLGGLHMVLFVFYYKFNTWYCQ